MHLHAQQAGLCVGMVRVHACDGLSVLSDWLRIQMQAINLVQHDLEKQLQPLIIIKNMAQESSALQPDTDSEPGEEENREEDGRF